MAKKRKAKNFQPEQEQLFTILEQLFLVSKSIHEFCLQRLEELQGYHRHGPNEKADKLPF